MVRALRQHTPVVLAAVVWVAAVVAGLGAVERHARTPGDAGSPRERWPASARTVREPGRANLVMAVHPRCPCTRASLAELARLMAHAQGRLSAHLLIWTPAERSPAWAHTDLWRAAEGIPGAQPVADPGGAEAKRFHLRTSGHVLVYDAAGRLRFSGGITPARGHEGDNVGLAAIAAILEGAADAPRRHAVFGCALWGHPGTEKRSQGP